MVKRIINHMTSILSHKETNVQTAARAPVMVISELAAVMEAGETEVTVGV